MGKRKYGEGCVSQRKDGRWAVIFRVGRDPLSGKYKKETYYENTYEEAEKLRIKKLNELNGLLMSDKYKPFEWFINCWLKGNKGNIKLASLIIYENVSRLHIIPKLGKVPINALSPLVIQEFIDCKVNEQTKTGQKLSPSSIHHIKIILNMILNCAVKINLIDRNPAKFIVIPSIVKSNAKALSDEEIARFLEAIQGHRLECLFLMAITTGMRQGEILGLKWSNVDIETGLIRVEASLKHLGKRSGETYTLSSTKTHAPRMVALPSFVLEKLKAHKLKQRDENLILGLSDTYESFVFITQNGTPYDDANVRRYYTNILIESKLPHYRFHDLRHTCATLLLNLGLSVIDVSTLLGHKNVDMTLNTYWHNKPVKNLLVNSNNIMQKLFAEQGNV